MKLNKNAFLQNIILIGFAFFMIKVHVTGEIARYVHPKMNVYILVCGIIFAILALLNFENMMTEQENKLNKSLLIFIIPLCLALFVPPTSLSASTIQNKGMNLGIYSNSNSNKQSNVAPGTKTNEGIEIKVTEDNYTQTMYNLHDQLDDYTGKTIQISGYIYKDDTFKSNEFVVGRTMIACCTADASLIGLKCEEINSENLKNDDWYVVTGKIKKVNLEGTEIPGIVVTNMEKTNKPPNEYVYP